MRRNPATKFAAMLLLAAGLGVSFTGCSDGLASACEDYFNAFAKCSATPVTGDVSSACDEYESQADDVGCADEETAALQCLADKSDVCTGSGAEACATEGEALLTCIQKNCPGKNDPYICVSTT